MGSSTRTLGRSFYVSSHLETIYAPYSWSCPDLKRLWWQEINLSKLLHLGQQLRGLRDQCNQEENFSFKMLTLLSNNWIQANNQNPDICKRKEMLIRYMSVPKDIWRLFSSLSTLTSSQSDLSWVLETLIACWYECNWYKVGR